MRRRVFLGQVLCVLGGGLGMVACRKGPTRQDVLSALVHDVLATDIVEIVAVSRQLDAAVQRLVAAPSAATLAESRNAWKGAIGPWKRGYCYRNGPLVETGALLRAAFWPARPSGIESLLAKPLPGGDYVGELGVDLKGLYALEYLLFGADKGASGVDRFTGAQGERVRAHAGAVAADVRAWSEKAEAALGDGRALAARLAGGGQQTLTFLVNQMVGTVETVHGRITQAQEAARDGRLRAVDVEGWPSGVSTAVLDSLVGGVEHLYAGNDVGLAALVRDVTPSQEPRFRSAFTSARASLQGLAGPLEDAARAGAPALETAARALKALELVLKLELASALGVTVTFSSSDGD